MPTEPLDVGLPPGAWGLKNPNGFLPRELFIRKPMHGVMSHCRPQRERWKGHNGLHRIFRQGLYRFSQRSRLELLMT